MLTAIHVLLPVLAVASAASLPEAVKWGSHDTPFSAALTLARATKRGCATGGAVLDVGARGGEQTFEALHHGFKVVAIECMANEYWNLHSMWLQQPNVTLLHLCAASPEQEGVMMLYNAEGATTLHPSTLRHYAEMARHRHADRRTEPVVALPLDKLFWRQRGADVFEPSNSVPAPLCALKLDIQGAEVSALHGLARTVAHYKPVVYVEYDHRLVKDLARGQRPRAWLERLGYSCVPDDSRESNLTTVEFAAADGIGAAGRVTAEYGCRSGYCDLTCSTDLSRQQILKHLMLWNAAHPKEERRAWHTQMDLTLRERVSNVTQRFCRARARAASDGGSGVEAQAAE